MTSGSIGTSSIDISPIEEHLEKKRSDLTGVYNCGWWKTEVVFSENDRTQGEFVGLDSEKYTLNRSIYELKLVRLLLSVFEPYGERSRYFVRSEDTRAAQSSLPNRPYRESIRLAVQCDH